MAKMLSAQTHQRLRIPVCGTTELPARQEKGDVPSVQPGHWRQLTAPAPSGSSLRLGMGDANLRHDGVHKAQANEGL